MTIRFRCPNPACKKVLGVPDHLAGRRATCPACKKSIKIPSAKAAAPAVNVEDLAAAAFADGPAAENGPAELVEKAQVITLTCPYCDEQVEFPAALGGKQAPCPNPECRRIVKVPMPAAKKAADWRKAGREGPQGTRENVQKALEAQEAANVKKAVVSRAALAEAGALPTRAEPIPTGDRIKRWIGRGLVALVVVGVGAGVWMWISQQQQTSHETNVLAEVLAWTNPKSPLADKVSADERKKLSPEMAAELNRALGVFYSHKYGKEELRLARNSFLATQSLRNEKNPSPGGAILLAQVVQDQLALAADNEDQVKERARLDWKEVPTELQRTLEAIGSTDGRLFALRELSGKLLAKNKGEIAVALARKLETGGRQSEVFKGEMVALLLALNKDAEAAKELPLPKAKTPLDFATRLAYAEGRARAGNFDEARQLARAAGPPLERLQAGLGVAAVALQGGKNAEAAGVLEDVVKIVSTELNPSRLKSRPLLFWQAARVAAHVGQAKVAENLAGLIADPEGKAQARLELFRKTLADGGQPSLDTVGDKKTLAYAQAVEALAVYKTRQRRRDEVLAGMEELEPQLRPFTYVGVALGEVSGR